MKNLTLREIIAMINSMKRIGVVYCLVLAFLFSCKSQEEPVKTQAVQPPPASPVEKPQGQQNTETAQNAKPSPVFDPSSISQEEKDTTKTEIQHLIQRLNGIIRARNYNAWVSYLSPDYFAVISSPEYLDRISQSTVLVKQKIVLKSAQDYFNNVVVPARANDRVDDIEFISQNRVKAYTINNRGERLRLYDLEKVGNEWKINN